MLQSNTNRSPLLPGSTKPTIYSNISRRPDIPAAPEPKWLGGCVGRHPDLPAAPEPDFLEDCVERHSDIPPGRPWSGALPGMRFPVPSPTPPDITRGLGKRQDKRDLVQLERFVAESLPLMVYRGKLYIYKPPYWKKLNDNQAATEVRAFLEHTLQEDCLTHREYQEIYRLLLINPNLLVEKELNPPEDMINMLDGTYDLRSGQLLPHNAEDYFFTCINVHGEEMDCCKGDVFEAFVRNCSGGDPEVREQLLQLVALTVLRKSLKHFYVLIGESNTGKTQFGRFLEELVGHESVASVQGMHDFGTQWTVGSLEGKLLATCLNLPDEPLPPIAVSVVKQLVGDDSTKGNRKYKDPITIYQKPLLLFAGNHPIQIPKMKKEQALMNRMVIIPFRNPVPDSGMHQEIYREFLDEAPYILKEALAAYHRLEQNSLQVTRSSLPPELLPRDSRAGFRSVEQFVAKCCTFGAGMQITTRALYDAYCDWQGDTSMNFIEFSRRLSEHLASYPDIEALKRVEGTNDRGYRGIRLNSEPPGNPQPL